MTTPKTSKPRGAPPKKLGNDPERYAIARATALMALGVSENAAFKISAAWLVGKPVAGQDVGPRRKRGRGAIPAGRLESYEQGDRGLIESKVATLRKKRDRAESDPEAKAWLVAMSRTHVLALKAKDYDRCASKIRELAEEVGEARYAEAVLLPLLAARFYTLAKET
jgi:hypothetical protein